MFDRKPIDGLALQYVRALVLTESMDAMQHERERKFVGKAKPYHEAASRDLDEIEVMREESFKLLLISAKLNPA